MSLAAEYKTQQPLPVGHGQAVLLAQLHLLVPVVDAGHTQRPGFRVMVES
jgi:hypothetical protein